MIGWRGIRLSLILALIVSVVGISQVGPAHAGTRSRTTVDWAQYDRAVYVVSTLNVVLCVTRHGSNVEGGGRFAGRQVEDVQSLPAVLRDHDGARSFDVLQSRTHQDLYFIEVRAASHALLGVYAYELGWALPRGVRDAKCVRPAPASIAAAYRPGSLVRIARFTTTLP